MSIHLLQCSIQHLKAVAKSATFRVLVPPSHSFLMVFLVRVRVRPASSLFTFGKRKKSPGARVL